MTTLAPSWTPEPLAGPEQAWYRLAGLGIELYVFTARGTRNHPNEDGFVVCQDERLALGVIDEATHKVGPKSRDILELAIEEFRNSAGSPNQRLIAAHFAIRRHLDMVGQWGRAGASAIALELSPRGRFRWASVGDCSAVLWRSQRWWRSGRISRLTAPQRCSSGQLLQALGMASVPLAEFDEGILGVGDMLLVGSDGVFHDAIDFASIGDRIAAHRKQDDRTLPELGMKIVEEARLTQPYPDDMCLALVSRFGNHVARMT